jgi:hypothetical protein
VSARSALRSPGSALGRAVRVAVLGGSSLLLATLAHRIGGGILPPPGVLLLCGFLLGLAGLLLTTRRLGFPLLLAALGAQQVLLHALFAAATTTAACTPAAAVHHALHTLACAPGSGMAPMVSWPMLLAHAVATAATAWLLARGEATWWRLAERVVRAAGCRAPGSTSARPGRPVTPAVRRVATAPLLARAAPRGPPPVLD